MKFKNYKRLILLTVIASLLVLIPVQSDAITRYRFTYDTRGIDFADTVVIRFNNNLYSIIKNQNQSQNSCCTIIENKNRITNNYYVVSRGSSSRPVSWPVLQPQPTPQPTPKPQPIPRPTPAPQPTPRPQPIPDLQPTPDPEPVPDSDTTSDEGHSLTSEEIQMIDYVNNARQDAGLQPLQIDPDLAHIAGLKSKDMYDNNYFSHDSPTYGSPFDMMTKFGIEYRGAAENIAKNNSVTAAHNAFMRSQGHKDNILNPIYTHIGIGIYNGYYTQMFISK